MNHFRKSKKELKISDKTFQRIFKDILVADLNLDNCNNLSDIKFIHGYADQSQYNRTFKEFTKIAPSDI